jgi:hypothetical protein
MAVTFQVEIRWGEGNPDLFRRYAIELVAHAPDVILGATVSPFVAGNPQHTARVRANPRSARIEFGAAGWQRHRHEANRIRHERKMAGVSEADRASCNASGRPSRCRQSRAGGTNRDSTNHIRPRECEGRALGSLIGRCCLRGAVQRRSAGRDRGRAYPLRGGGAGRRYGQ